MHSQHDLRSLHGLQSTFYHDHCNHCRVQFTHVVNGRENLEGQNVQKRLNPTGFAWNTNMAADHTFPITINFEQIYIYGYLMGEVYFLVEFSPFERNLNFHLNVFLIFGVQNNKFEDFIKQYTHLCLLSFFLTAPGKWKTRTNCRLRFLHTNGISGIVFANTVCATLCRSHSISKLKDRNRTWSKR